MNDEIRKPNDELPDGWSKVPLAEVVDVLDSKRIPLNSDERERRIRGKSESDLVPYYGATGQVGFIDDAIFDEPLILLGEDGVPFFDPLRHKAYRVSGRTWVNNHAHVLRARREIADERFITAFLNSFDYTGYVSGSTRLKLTQGSMNSIPVTLAPLAEQKRIADKLEAVLGRVDACRARLDRVPALLKRFRQSVLASATSGGLTAEWREETNTTEGPEKTLGEVIKVSSGKALTAKNMAAGGSIPVFGGNGINGYHDHGNVAEETLVIGRVGYYCGCVHMTPQVAWVTDNALIVRHNATESSKRYLFYALQALDLRTNDAATAQPVISGQKIYSLLLTLPTLPEQQEIVRRVEDLFAFADRIEARLTTAQKTVERLTPATLAKAFRGELVPQDPNGEPASVLLERIRKESAERSQNRQPGRNRIRNKS